MLGCPIPAVVDAEGHNAFLADEIAKDPLSRASMIATPAMTPQDVADMVGRYGFVGLKPYRLMSATGDVVECRITDYLPEKLIEVADDMGLFVTLHLSKRWGCADKENLSDLAYLTGRYPRVRWILAHCARSFASWMIEQAIGPLSQTPRIWYDLSAVNDVMTFYILFKRERRERLLFGTDNLIAGGAHSKYITFAKAWAYIPDAVFKQLDLSHCEGEPTLVVYEQLRAMRHAAEMVGFGSAELEEIFYGNAARLLEVQG
jgi:glutamate-1-semialdehyde 2,1-aminomutase